MGINGKYSAKPEDDVTLSFTLYVKYGLHHLQGNLGVVAEDFSQRFQKEYKINVRATPTSDLKDSTWEGRKAKAIDFQMVVDGPSFRALSYDYFKEPTEKTMKKIIDGLESTLYEQIYLGVKFPSESVSKTTVTE